MTASFYVIDYILLYFMIIEINYYIELKLLPLVNLKIVLNLFRFYRANDRIFENLVPCFFHFANILQNTFPAQAADCPLCINYKSWAVILNC